MNGFDADYVHSIVKIGPERSICLCVTCVPVFCYCKVYDVVHEHFVLLLSLFWLWILSSMIYLMLFQMFPTDWPMVCFSLRMVIILGTFILFFLKKISIIKFLSFVVKNLGNIIREPTKCYFFRVYILCLSPEKWLFSKGFSTMCKH